MGVCTRSCLRPEMTTRESGDGQYGLNLTIVQRESNNYYGGHAVRAHGASTPPLLTNVTLSRAGDGIDVLEQYSVGPEIIKSGAECENQEEIRVGLGNPQLRLNPTSYIYPHAGASSTSHVFVPMRHFYDNATYAVTLQLDATEALAEWPKGATRAPSVWEADTGLAEVNNVRRCDSSATKQPTAQVGYSSHGQVESAESVTVVQTRKMVCETVVSRGYECSTGSSRLSNAHPLSPMANAIARGVSCPTVRRFTCAGRATWRPPRV